MDNKFKYFSSLVDRKNIKYVLGKNQVITLPDCPIEELPKRFGRSSELVLTRTYIDEWKGVFQTDLDMSDARIPFMYHWPHMIQVFTHQILPAFGIAMKNTFHIGMEYEIADADALVPGALLEVSSGIVDLIPWKPRKALVDLVSEVRDRKTGKLIFRGRDYTGIMGVTEEEIAMIEKKGLGKKGLPWEKEEFRHRKPKFPEPRKGEFAYFMDEKLDHRYGLASGGYTLTHGIKILAKIFERGKPFIQAAAMTNLVLGYLMVEKKVRIKNFKAFFNNRHYFPGMATLRTDDHNFEWFDDKGIMTQYGSYNY